MAYIGGSGALILETQSSTGSWNNGLSQITDPLLGSAIGLQDDLIPTSDAAYDIGTKLKRIRTIHTTKLNDDSTGETLEIGNYTADTGVTGVYGQLQGKGGSWKLSTTAGNGVLGGAGITIGPDSGITYVNGGLSASGFVAQAGIYNVRQGGAKGDGVTDDTTAIQAGIDYCRANNLTLWFPNGKYKITSPLNWSQWQGIHVKGGSPGPTGLGSSFGNTSIVTSGITGIANDFSGCAYGTIEGIGFASISGTPKCHILLARTTGGAVDYGSDITFDNVNVQGGTTASVILHSAEVVTFRNCKIQFGGGPGILITNKAGSAPWSVTPPSGSTLVSAVTGCTVYRIEGGEITGDNAACVQLDWNGANSGADFSMFGCYLAISGSNTYGIRVGGPWLQVICKNTRIEATSLGSNYGGYLFAPSAVDSTAAQIVHGEIDGDLNAGPFITGTGSLYASKILTTGAINLTGTISACEIMSVNPLSITLTGNLLASKATVPSVGTLSVSGTKEITVNNVDYHSTIKTIAGDTGLTVQNTALNKNLVLDPTTGAITGNSVPVIIASGGNGVTIRPANGQNTTIGDTSTATTWINPGSGASTTLFVVGSNNGSSTNTINIGLVPANDVITFKGTVVRQPEFLHLALTSTQTLSNNGYNNVPSMSSVVSSAKYLAWDDTNHYFKNNHPTATLTVAVTMSASWAAGTAARTMFVAWGASNWSYVTSWAAGDTGPRGGSVTVQVAAGATIIPWFSTANTTEQVNGGAGANSQRFIMTATVI